jgi:urease accessory protein UreF
MVESESEWTVDTLRVYLLDVMHTQFAAQEKAVAAALAAAEKAVTAALLSADKAVDKANEAHEKRLDSVNEFRAQLADQASTFMPRLESEQRAGSNTEKITAVATRLDKLEGRSDGVSASWAYLVAGISLIALLVGIYVATTGK